METERLDANEPIKTYREFWLYYLAEHAAPGTRLLHFLGTGSALLLLIAFAVTANWWYLLAAVISGYFFAWTGHLAVERNRPATFRYPLWSLASDWRMFFLWLAGRLEGELKRAGVAGR